MPKSLVGSRLAHFELTAQLGQGGMGEVYLATDTRLGRKVAIKVLPAELAHHPELRARLEREARAVSQLNHRNICTLYELGVADDLTFLVMEYLEGETLEARLERGALPLSEALRLATEVASALAAAHSRGLVHRDIKPGNLMLTADGAKLLDFGLVKALAVDKPDALATDAPTIPLPITVEGSVLGTPQYMAPEQVSGGETDARTDIFAFGMLLYEMLCGKKAFTARSAHELAAKILHEEPLPLQDLVAGLPAALTRLVRRCLAKDKVERWQCSADLADELRFIASSEGGVSAQIAKGRRPARTRDFVVGALAGVLAAVIIFFINSRVETEGTVAGEAATSLAPTRFDIELPQDASFLPDIRSALAISPNGREIVYVGGDVTHKRLYARWLDQEKVEPLIDTAEGSSPFFSPDGERIGFLTRYSLRYVPARGGPSQAISFAPPVTRGASWFDPESVVIATSKAGHLIRLGVSTGEAEWLTAEMDTSSSSGESWPFPFAGSRKVLVTSIGPTDTTYNQAKIVAIDLAAKRRKIVVEGGSQARFLPTGHVVFVREGSLYAAPFDDKAMQMTAAPVVVLDQVLYDPESGNGYLAISPSGTLVYARGGTVKHGSHLSWIDSSGVRKDIPTPPGQIVSPRLSPDGTRIVFSLQAVTDDLWLYDLKRGTCRRLTFGGRNTLPFWTPDGKSITYTAVRPNPRAYTIAADGSGKEERVGRGSGGVFPGSWTPDGKILAVTRFSGPPSHCDIMILGRDEEPRDFLASQFNETAPAISPDGALLAYCSDESGQWEVYVTSFPKAGEKLQVSNGGGMQPVWSRRGRRLIYRSDDRLLSVRIDASPRLVAGVPSVLISHLPPIIESAVPGAPLFDLSANEDRVLCVERDPLTPIRRLAVVVNWFADLERKVPIPN